uniref:RDR1/2-like PH-like domain-containing protein n=1 Tax=Ananas comosus var. bracteatus TaxID=296719 RepID=A0A6V7P7F3_ANACO|nr:unnamed protein product [Ananas comosus var. bracteatus]
MERDIVPKPRASLFVVEHATLHFGCPGSFKYKLELSYESIWEIQLHRSSDQETDFQFWFLKLQMAAAPKIYELALRSSGLVHEDPLLNYFKETPDDQWIRSTDFFALMQHGTVICNMFAAALRLRTSKYP